MGAELIGIVGHTSRLAQIETLAQQVEADYISIDDGTLGCDGSHRKVLTRLANSDDPWAIILEDDAQPINNFTEQATLALAAAPTPIVSFYLGTSRPPSYQARIQAATTNADHIHYLQARRLLHAVAYAIHTELIPDFLGYQSARPIDEAITAWANHHGHGITHTWPSLTDHEDGPTLFAHPDGAPRTKPRKAWRVGTRETWDGTAVRVMG